MSRVLFACLLLFATWAKVNCNGLGDEASVGQGEDNSIPGHDDVLDRTKRNIIQDEDYLWPNGTIPYTYAPDVDAKEIREIEAAMSVYEHYSPIRFVKWTNESTVEGRVVFLHTNGRICNAKIGFSKGLNRHVRCCNRRSCIHELGHVVGFQHELSNPNRNKWVRINWEHISGHYNYYIYDDPEPKTFTSNRYDYNSFMHYKQTIYRIDQYRWEKNFNYLFYKTARKSHFYMFKEIGQVYGAENYPQCKGHTLTCHNDGYVSVVGGVCSCICPRGLDPGTGCQTILKHAGVGLEMPKGTFIRLSDTDDCPAGTRKSTKMFPKVTHACFNATTDEVKPDSLIHVADVSWPWVPIETSKTRCPPGYDAKARLRYYVSVMYVCKSTTNCNRRECEAPAGSYCYLRHSHCPRGRRMNTRHIVVPGPLAPKERKLNFCCLENGLTSDESKFPVDTKFSLFLRDKECQTITGMHVTKRQETIDKVIKNNVEFGSTSETHISLCVYQPKDLDCGDVIDLDETNPSFSLHATASTSSYRHCTWLFKGPNEDGELVLNIQDSYIRNEGILCVDTLEVMNIQIGQPGHIMCGRKVWKYVTSVYDKMMVRLFTTPDSGSHITATVTWIPAKDWCYKKEDGGKSYAGKVNYTKRFKSCIPWTKATKCRYNPFDGSATSSLLEGNYCRNPDESFYPWCYTDEHNCEREFCDVCHHGSEFDRADDCDKRGAAFCNQDLKSVVEKCAKTCEDTIKEKKFSEISCPPPGKIYAGILQGTPKTSYGVGDAVTYKCRGDPDESRSVERICLTSGQWSVVNTACTECPLGFTPLNSQCYKFFEITYYFVGVKKHCVDMGAILASPKSKEENDLIVSIRPKGIGKTWIGAVYNKKEKKLKWSDGTDFVYYNNASSLEKVDENTYLTIDNDGKWYTMKSFEIYPYVCQMPAKEPDCVNYMDNCEELINVDGVTCDKFPGLRNTCGLSCDT